MTDCNYLGEVQGSAGRTRFANVTLLRNTARHEALEVALGKGATHVRWLHESADWISVNVTAQAFDCTTRNAAPHKHSDETR